MAAGEVNSVQLVSEQQAGNKCLHNFAIEDKWKDLHVAVIGIMGDKNSGKSFLMNVIAEYLRFEESETGGWTNNFKNGKTTVSGFELKEIENITKFNDGLYIWPRPFLIKRSGDSKEIAVILLDLNMKEVTPSMQLIMSLLCSTIIYNTNSNDVYKLCLLIKAIKQSRLEVRCEEITSSLKDLLFENVIMVFRDLQIKFGQDKSLKHIKSVVKGNQFLEACDDKSNIDSYLLPKPTQCVVNAQGYLEMDKTFSRYITSMITKAFSIDNLRLKSWNGSAITVKKLFSILEFICNFDLPLLQEFNLSAESSIEESMETNSEDTNPFLDNDVELEDVQIVENKNSSDKSTTLRLAPYPHLMKEKLNEEKYLQANGKTEETKKEAIVKQRNEADSTRFNDNGEVEGTRQNIFVTNEEINNKIEKIEKAVGIKAKRFYESQKCTPDQIENEFRRIYEKANEEFEKFCSTHTIKNQVGILSTFDNMILGIIEERVKKANGRDEEKLGANKPKDISHVIESQLQLYNESMTELQSASMSVYKKTLSEKHRTLMETVTSTIMRVCNEQNIFVNDVLPLVLPKLEHAYKSYQIGVGPVAEDLQNKIQGAVKKAHSEYINTMRKNINGKTYSASELQNLHTNCLREAAVVMKLDIRAIDKNTDPQMYLNKLQMKTENEFKIFSEQNNKAIQQNNKSFKPHTRQDTNEEMARRHQECLGETYTSFTDATHNDTKTKEKSVPIIAIEFGLHTIKTGVIVNGMFKFVPNEFAESEFPNVVAITKQGEVLIGNEVLYRSADVSYQFHPGKLMKLPPDEVTAAYSEKVQFQGQDVLAIKEFLCGLILSRIKKYSELFLKQCISAAVITVPLWYTSSQRQATKDAGVIAGFQSVNLINDITAGALAYAKQPYNRNRYHDVLIINAIGGNVDVAVYEMSGGEIKMKTCAGFLHGQTYFEQSVSKLREMWKNVWHGSTSASGEETAVVKKLVEYCVKNNYYVTVSTVLFDKDTESNHQYLDNLKFIATRKGRHYFQIEGAILIGAAIFADLLNNCSEYTAKSSKSDLLPYQIEFGRPNSNGKIFESHVLLPSTELKQDITLQSNDDAPIPILEIGNAGNIKTGFLHVPGKESGTSDNEVTAIISSEGILRFTAKQRYGAVLWNSYNLTEEKIAKYALLIGSYYPNPEQLKVLQSCKVDLQKLAQALFSYSDHTVSGLGKQRISDMVQEAFKAADAEYTTLERIEQITNDLVQLKRKYCSDM